MTKLPGKIEWNFETRWLWCYHEYLFGL